MPITNKSYSPLFFKFLLLFLQKGMGWMLCLALVFTTTTTLAQDVFIDEILDPIVTYDEVPVEITVKGYIKFETDVIITNTNLVYINMEELFTKLGIYIVSENEGNSLRGFIENETKLYHIDFDTKMISVGQKKIRSINGIVKEMGGIYIESNVISEAFGLQITFNYRTLSIKLDASFELPLVKKARIENIRQNISQLQAKPKEPDVVIGRTYNAFQFGTVDWSVSSYQTKSNSYNRFGLGVGTELLYGEANVAVNYYDNQKFDNRNLYYHWRWIDNENPFVKQVQLGKIGQQSIAFLNAPVIGGSFNNSPNTVRKANGFYTINEFTEPHWTVELYINDVLVDYTTADASGMYVFKVPIVYGYTTLKLKFYGPLGEERMEERVMNTPYTFIPANEIEYSVSGGVLQDGEGSQFARGVVNYGVNRFITIGGGLEYFSNIPDHPYIPFANIAFQPFTKMVMNFEYAHNVKIKGIINYNFGRSAFLEIDYAKFVEGQQATRFNASEERKVRFSMPFKWNTVSGYSKLNFNQYVYDAFTFNQVDLTFTGHYKKYGANLSTLMNWLPDNPTYLSSNLELSYRMKNGLAIRPSLHYNISDNQFLRYRLEVEKRVAKMNFSASYERNVISQTNNVFLSFQYDLDFARTGASAFYSNNSFSFSENAQGSFAFGGDNGYVHMGNNSSLSKGGILFYPFLDLNQNGELDPHEEMIQLNNVRVSGGKAIISEKDFIVRVSDLNAFIPYTVEFSDNQLDNISWKFKDKIYQILVDPNQYKKVYVPIHVMGEVSGMVHLTQNDVSKGQGRVTLQIFDDQGEKVVETMSESDGYFSYLGLKTGSYTIRVDEKQLKKLNYTSTPLSQAFIIDQTDDGAMVEGVKFNLTSTIPQEEQQKTKIQEEGLQINPADNPEGFIDPSFGRISDIKGLFYTVQVAVTKKHLNARQLNNLSPIFYEILTDGTVVYVYGTFDNINAAINAKNFILFRGIRGAQVVVYNNGERVGTDKINTKEKVELEKDSVRVRTFMNFPVDKNINPSFNNVFDIKELFYTVQIGVFKKFVTAEQLRNLLPVFYEVMPSGNVRYLSGTYEEFKEAKVAKNKIVAKGIKDAYVVAYKDGEQLNAVTLKKAPFKKDKRNGEVYGSVLLNTLQKGEGIKNLSILLFNQNGNLVGVHNTDENGNFGFVNLIPGEYTVKIDSNQLEQLNYKSTPLVQNIFIKESSSGDVLEGLDFLLTKLNN